jgi:N-acyl-D-amino-acid deacylase
VIEDSAAPALDLLITGGTVVDGTGGPGRAADVGIRGGRIAFIGDAEADGVAGAGAARTIDAAGCVVAPGFVDVHTHADFTIETRPDAESYLRQGVTTVVTGNCGNSAFPAPAFGVDFAAYAARVAGVEPAVHVAALVGHAALRTAVVGTDRRAATDAEVAEMGGLLDLAARQGAFGLSTGLIYAPGSFADSSEVRALAAVAARHGLVYATHLRDEGDGLLDALDEALTVARETGVRLQVSHLKAMGRANHGKVREALSRIDAARSSGFDVACDVYPYTASSTLLTSRLPDWAMDGGPGRLLERLADPAVFARLAGEIEDGRGRAFYPEAIVLAELPPGRFTRWLGSSLTDIGAELGLSPAATLLEVLRAHEARVWIVNHAMDEQDVRTVLEHPWCAVGSDGWEMSTDCAGSPHPRHFGAFARVLAAYCRDEHLLTLPETVRRMTALPAARLGLSDRGVLAPGLAGDVTVFDPDLVADKATYTAPKAYAVGTRAVLVDGVPVLLDGEPTGARPGRVLRRGPAGRAAADQAASSR